MNNNVYGNPSYGNPNRGSYIYKQIEPLYKDHANALKNILEPNIPNGRSDLKSTDFKSRIVNTGLTSIESALLEARDYLVNGLPSRPWPRKGYYSPFGTSTGEDCEAGYPCDELPSCGNTIVILVTDGLPSVDKNGTIGSSTALSSGAITAAQKLKSAGIKTYGKR